MSALSDGGLSCRTEQPLALNERERTLRHQPDATTIPGRHAAASGAITVVIVDDHPAILDSVGRYLESQGIDVLGTAADGSTGVELIEQLRPKVAILDLRLPGLSGLEAVLRLRQRVPETRLLLYTGAGDNELVYQSLSAGALGVIQKDASLLELVRAVDIVADDKPYIDGRLASFMLSGPSAPLLTARELDVLRLLAEGNSNEAIAAELHIAPDTVRAHLRKAMRKLGSRTRTQAVATALRRSVIT